MTPDALEMVRCAQANFENALTLMPALKLNGLFKIAMMQLAQGIELAEKVDP